MSIEEVERIIGETQDAVEYQRVSTGGAGSSLCSAQSRDGHGIQEPPGWECHVLPCLPQQIDELLAGSLTEEDEDAILEELNAITQVGLMFL